MNETLDFEKILQDAGITALIQDSKFVESIKTLMFGCAIAGGDAGLDYLEQNLKSVDFGNFNGIIQTLVPVVIPFVRKLLHSGLVVK